MAFWFFFNTSQPPISSSTAFLDTAYRPCCCCCYHRTSDFHNRFPLPAYNDATHRHAVRTVGLSVYRSPSRTCPARPICHRMLIYHRSSETPIDILPSPVRLCHCRRRFRENGSWCRSTPVAVWRWVGGWINATDNLSVSSLVLTHRLGSGMHVGCRDGEVSSRLVSSPTGLLYR
jgi:hypothetical protein